MKLEFSGQIMEKYSNIKYEYPFRGSGVVPCGQTDGRTDRQTDMTKLIIAFRSFGNAPKIVVLCSDA
jgi:hypothetical protein